MTGTTTHKGNIMLHSSLRSWTTIVDKSEWGVGPWCGEPDKVQWTDATTGLPCLAVRNLRHGCWCGYAAVNPGHPLHGRSVEEAELPFEIEVNYADGCSENEDLPAGQRICHIPEPGRPDDVWWFGFDCGHVWDYQPARAARERAEGLDLQAMAQDVMPEDMRPVYRTLDYVMGKCTALATMLAARQQ